MTQENGDPKNGVLLNNFQEILEQNIALTNQINAIRNPGAPTFTDSQQQIIGRYRNLREKLAGPAGSLAETSAEGAS
ncbi:hypothetical protein [Desulfonatronum thioautotrophicum]|uniref:hypothetical protein n=1 Tax=Desulfonatronum thioautotrophicum TaxID=617001 RepID=UPI0005EB6974|nr:hypothetical protein [Desulfonatronum thioautotrophicum]